MKLNYRMHYQSGQVGLVVLLIMVVLLTMGLSIMSQSTKDVTQSRQEEETTRVFNAAEAGIEQALTSDFTNLTFNPGSQTIGTSTYNFDITPATNLETDIKEGHSAEINLVGAAFSGNSRLRIYWGSATDSCPGTAPAIIVSIYSDSGTPVVQHNAYSACNSGDNFTVSNDPDPTYLRSIETRILTAADRLVRIRSVYAASPIRVTPEGFGNFPAQSHTIVSTGTSDIGDETRAIEVDRTRPIAPSIFDYAVFSGGALIHN